jgi:hypothetical protein
MTGDKRRVFSISNPLDIRTDILVSNDRDMELKLVYVL